MRSSQAGLGCSVLAEETGTEQERSLLGHIPSSLGGCAGPPWREEGRVGTLELALLRPWLRPMDVGS